MQSLRRKFNALAGTTPPTGDAVIPKIVQKAKDVQRAIEIKMDSGGVGSKTSVLMVVVLPMREMVE